MIPTLLGVTFVVFIMVRAMPGDVATLILGEFGAGDAAAKEAILKEYSLDDNVVLQYVRWLGHLIQFDLGSSIVSGRPVMDELSNRIPITFQLGLMAIFFSLLIAVPVGIISAIRQDTWADYFGRSFAIGMLAVPNFWVALIVISLSSTRFHWAVLPRSYVPFTEDPIGNLKYLWFPALLLGAGLSGSVMRFTRSTMLDVLRQDYIRTAWAKGLRERAIITRHALRNALIPVVTVVGLQLPILVGGTVIIESIYNIPGMGRYYISAILTLDYPVIQGINIIVALVVVFANLGVDLTYSILDPRIRFSR